MLRWITPTITIVLSLLALNTPAMAKDLEACQTNFGPEGKLYLGLHAMVSAPVDYDEITVEGTNVEVYNDIRMGRQTLVEPYATSGQPTNALTRLKPVFQFTQDGEEVYRCAADVHKFDPATTDLTDTAVGDCDFELEDGLPELIAGQGQVYKLPRKLAELAYAPRDVLLISTLSFWKFWIAGLSAGSGQIVWLEYDVLGQFGGLCPFSVLEEHTPQFATNGKIPTYCSDSDGNPLHLKVGEYAKLLHHHYDRSPLIALTNEVNWPNAPVQLLTRLDSIERSETASFEIRAKHPGEMSLVKHVRHREYQTCIIKVE